MPSSRRKMNWCDGIAFNEVFPGGALLKVSYGPPHVLCLWHWAYRDGQPIILARVMTPGALEVARDYWAAKLGTGWMPPQVQDVFGQSWERKWETLEEVDDE